MSNETSTSIRIKAGVVAWLKSLRSYESEQPARVLDRLADQVAVIEPHDEGGYKITLPDGFTFGKYPTIADASSVAMINGYKAKIHESAM